MQILAIDPGTTESAYVSYETRLTELCDIRELRNIVECGIFPNEDIVSIIRSSHSEHLAIEMVACYGMAVGKTVFDTCVWVGRFIEAYVSHNKKPYTRVYRKDVCMHLCHSMRAKDSNIRQAIIDRYPAIGGGKTPQVGVKSKPGPLYGVSTDVWAALGVAITFTETVCPAKP